LADAGVLNVERLVLGPISTNCYIVWREGHEDAVVIDPGAFSPRIQNILKQHGLECRAIINTHGHPDHIGGNGALRDATGAPVYVGALDADMLAEPDDVFHVLARSGGQGFSLVADHTLEGGNVLRVGEMEFEVLATPGHTPGGISLLLPDDLTLFTGDTLFACGVGRTDFAGGDEEALWRSIFEVIFSLDERIRVYPGHGPDTTIAAEKAWHGRSRIR
jgi:hydroxyacylglutathione hydrolase